MAGNFSELAAATTSSCIRRSGHRYGAAPKEGSRERAGSGDPKAGRSEV